MIGASRRRGSIGGELFRNILAADFTGAAYPVNLKGEPVAGVRAYRSLDEIPDPVDLAVICLPGEQVLDAAAAALAPGVRALCVISAGFAETRRRGRARQERLLALVRAHGARLVGPNCLGIAVPGVRPERDLRAARAAAGPDRLLVAERRARARAAREGGRARRSASRPSSRSATRPTSRRTTCSSGGRTTTDTDLVLLYLESFGNPRAFARVARRVARRKPILALKAGSTRPGSRAASSHTAALAGSDAAVDALFHQAGVLRARTLEELVDAAALLVGQPLPAGRRVGVITNAGGLGILCADACEAAGLELPELTERDARRARRGSCRARRASRTRSTCSARRPATTYEAVIPLVLADPSIDALIVLFVPPVVAGADEVAAAIRRAVEPRRAGRSRCSPSSSAPRACPPTLRGAGSPVVALPYPESAARALASPPSAPSGCAGRRDGVRASTGSTRRRPRGRGRAALADVGRRLARRRTRRASCSRPTASRSSRARRRRRRTRRSPPPRELGFPAVVKTADAGRAQDRDRRRRARPPRRGRRCARRSSRIGAPVLVQPFLRGGAELLAGVVQDPVFGPLVAFGPGGVLAELIGDAGSGSRRSPTSTPRSSCPAARPGRLVAGFRGAPPADAAALVDLVLRLGRLADELPEVAELDLNPVLAGPRRLRRGRRPRPRPQARGAERRLKSW